MKPPPLPPDEARRLEELARYEILDSLPEAAFDDIVALAAEICGTPISAITFIDEERQWIKAAVGLQRGETTRDQSFCGHTIVDPQPLIVEDTEADLRFRDNPAVTGEPNIRFYAGAPLVTPAGAALGALCVVDRVPRRLTPNQQAMLQRLAYQVVAQLDLRRLHKEAALAFAERDRAERQLRLLHDLSVEIAEAEDAPAALSLTLERLCRFLGWQLGGAWRPDPTTGTLSCTEAFFIATPALEKFRAVSRGLSLPIGFGLPGQAWSGRTPLWIDDIGAAPGIPRGPVAFELGLKTAAAFPVKAGDEIVAVLEFFSTERRPIDHAFMSLVAGAAADLGAALRRKGAEDAMKASEVRFRSVTDSAPDAVVVADERSRIVSWNPAAERIFGHPAAEAVGQSLSLIIPAALRAAHMRGMERVLQSGRSELSGKVVELVAVRKDGGEFPVEMSVATWQTEKGRFFSGIIRDVSERKQVEEALRASEEALRHQATHDALTNLKNRRAVLAAAESELARSSRHRHQWGVALIDLDSFKKINDTFGHGVGDEVLREASRRLVATLRAYDVLGRYGGEEFLVVLPGCDEAMATAAAGRLRRCLGTSPFGTTLGEITVTCSIGVAIWSGERLEELIAAADTALYEAKAGGRDRVEVATRETRRQAR